MYAEQAVAQWLNSRLQLIGVLMISCVAFLAAGEHHLGGEVDAGLVGLSISYALSVTNLLQGLVTAFTETEKEMVNVERVSQYIGITSETVNDRIGPAPSPQWPQQGRITFHRVNMTYRAGLRPALYEVTLSVAAGQKVGIVGRTGAGKSSLLQVR